MVGKNILWTVGNTNIQINNYCVLVHVVPENICTFPMEGIFFQHLPTSLEIPVKLHTFI